VVLNAIRSFVDARCPICYNRPGVLSTRIRFGTMEEEIDLRPYLQAVLRQWRWILGAVLIALLAAVAFTLAQPRASRASATVLIDPLISQVVLDARFSERDTGLFSSATTRRQALLDLAESPVLEARVIAAVGDSKTQPGDLLRRVEVSATSDLLTITASGPDAAEAGRLAQAWGQAYEQLVAELYSGGNLGVEQIETELAEAQARHAQARRDLDAFLRQGDLVQADQEVSRLQRLLETSRESQQALYTSYLSRTQELNLVLEDARALRAQLQSSPAGAPGDALAALVLRLRAAGGEQLPVDLSVGSPESLTAGREATLGELEQLIAVLQAERDRVVAETGRIAAAIAAGDTSAVGVDPQARARYERELAAAQGRLAELFTQQRVLSQTVDLAQNTLAVLQAKRDEQVIARTTASVNVRYLGSGPVRPPSLLFLLLRNAVLAALLVGFLAVSVVIAREIVRQVSRPAATPGTPRGGPAADRTAASD